MIPGQNNDNSQTPVTALDDTAKQGQKGGCSMNMEKMAEMKEKSIRG